MPSYTKNTNNIYLLLLQNIHLSKTLKGRLFKRSLT